MFTEDLCVRHYTGYVSLCSPGDLQFLRRNTIYISKCFDIFREAFKGLNAFYKNVQPGASPNPERLLPDPSYPENYVFKGGFDPRKLKFLKRVDFRIRYWPMLWEATYEKEDVYVKFTETYHKVAHETLAALDPPLAPKLYFADKIMGGVWMVVMEKLDCQSAENTFDQTTKLPESVVADVETALRELHNKRLVFGDLRRPNIMVHWNDKEEKWRAKLIDFDSCGTDFEKEPKDDSKPWFYDCYLNDFSVDGMNPTAAMRMSHDDIMLQDAIAPKHGRLQIQGNGNDDSVRQEVQDKAPPSKSSEIDTIAEYEEIQDEEGSTGL
jgi:hypothetical protein